MSIRVGSALNLKQLAASPIEAALSGETLLYVKGNSVYTKDIDSGTGSIGEKKLRQTIAVKVSTTGQTTLSGTQTIDGVALGVGDIVLARHQGVYGGNIYDNGPWVVASGAWTRPAWGNTSAKLAGQRYEVQAGSSFAGFVFRNTFQATDTLGTTGMALVNEIGADFGSIFGIPAMNSNSEGATFIDSSSRIHRTWNGATWINAKGIQDVATSPPAYPAVGEIYIDQNTGSMYWTGSQWLPTGVPAAETYQVACSANTTVSTSLIDIPGLTQTISVSNTSEVFLITVSLDVSQIISGTPTFGAYLVVDGATQGPAMAYAPLAQNARATVVKQYRITGLAAGSHTFKVQANTALTNANQVNATNSIMTIQNSVLSVQNKNYIDQSVAGRPSYSYASPLSGLKNTYSTEFGIYNYKYNNTRIMTQGLGSCMMGKSGGGMTEHLWIGDSISSGTVSAVGTYVHDWLNTIALSFRDNMANEGVPANGSGFVRFTDSNTGSDSRLSFTGSWSNTNLSMLACSTVNSTLTFIADRDASVLDVWWYDATGATFTISVNGATSGTGFATVVCTGAAGWKYTHLTGLNIRPGSKVVITETVHGTFGTFLSGLSTYTPNAGLIMHNVAQSGALASGTGSSSWVDVATNTAPGQVFQYVGGTSRTVTDATSTVGSPNLGSATAAFTANDVGRPFDQTQAAGGPMFPYGSYIGAVTSGTVAVVHQLINGVSTPVNALQTLSAQTVKIGREPTCVHIALGVNDMINSATPATITSAITTIRNRYPNSDCILHVEPEMAYSFVPQATQLAYVQAMYDLADTLDVPLYDWRDRVGTYAQGQATGAYGDQNVHLSGAAQASLGSSLAQIIGFGSAQPQTGVVPVFDHDLTNRKWVEDTYGRISRITPGSTVLTTTETIVAQYKVPANMLKVNSQFRYQMNYRCSVASVSTVRIRVGTAGTIADAAVVAMSAGASVTGPKYAEGNSTVQAIGASATHLGNGTESQGTASATGTAIATSGTFDSTKDVWVSLTVQSTTSNTTTMQGGQLEIVL